jgi:hypothetical protein
VVLALGAMVPSLSCSVSTTLNGLKPSTFAESIVQSLLQEERLLQDTCQALGKQPDDTSLNDFKELKGALEVAQRRNFNVVCSALCFGSDQPKPPSPGGATCACDKGNFKIEPRTSGELTPAVLQVLGETLAEQTSAVSSQTRTGFKAAEQAAQERVEKVISDAKRALEDPETTKRLIARFSLSRAGLFITLRLADQAQRLAEHLASSFSIFQGLALPVLERAAAGIVATAMDEVLNWVEKSHNLPRADVAKEACRLRERIEPKATVAGLVLERAVLRYARESERSKPDATFRSCEALSSGSGKDDGTKKACETMRDKVEGSARQSVKPASIQGKGRRSARPGKPPPTASKAAEAPARSTSDLKEWLRPKPPMSDTAPNVEAQANALRASAQGCVDVENKAAPAERRSCTLERVLPVASYIYMNGLKVERTSDVSAIFASAEQRMSALQEEIEALRKDMQKMEGSVQDVAKAIATFDETLNVDRKALADALRWQADVLERRGEEIRRLQTSYGNLALHAYDNKCKAPYEETLQRRKQLGEELGFKETCPDKTQEKSDSRTSKIKSTKFPDLEANKGSFCEATSDLKLLVKWQFEGCAWNVTCEAGNRNQPGLCLILDTIAVQIKPHLATESLEKPPFVIQGWASHRLPLATPQGNRCWNAAISAELAEYGAGRSDADNLRTGLSFLRAYTVTTILLGKLGLKPGPAVAKKYFELHAMGAGGEPDCRNIRDQTGCDEKQEQLQRVDIALRLDAYRHDFMNCVFKK